MMRPAPEVTVYLCVAPVDMRKQAASLALLVEQSLGHNVFDASLYVFTNRRRDRVRIVYWERNGLCLWSGRRQASCRINGNGLEPYAYLCRLFERLPHAKTVEDFEALLPFSAFDLSPQ